MLSVEGLNIRYGEIVAVSRVDLAVGDGEIVALVGANGAGKSSTLNGIAGLSRASAGKVMFDNVDITNVPPELIARRGISLVLAGPRQVVRV
jgi:branched-chain amino acid transport system ATP-binding protein